MANITDASGLFQRYIRTYDLLKGGSILERVSHKLLADAEAGDIAAQRLVFQHSIPTLKSVTQSVNVHLPAGSPLAQLDVLFSGLTNGLYTPEQVLPIIDVLKMRLDVKEMAELKANLAKLERTFAVPEGYRHYLQ